MTDAVLLIAFGGPTKPDEIRPFLQNVARGRRIPPERLEDVAHHYEQMPGGRSPLNDLTFMQARSLAAMHERQIVERRAATRHLLEWPLAAQRSDVHAGALARRDAGRRQPEAARV